MKKHLATLAVAATALALTACSSGDPLASSAPASSTPASSAAAISVVVGSADFPESELLADIYAGALKAKGIAVSTKLKIGSRETYVLALTKGEIDLIPEYTGAFSIYLDANADTSTEAAALASLKSLLPEALVALDPSKAQDKDSITVTRATADRYSLKTIEDLAPVAGQLVLGGPPEWKNRALGVPGLKKTYGLTFKEFKPLSAGIADALKTDKVQAANLFTTDPSIKGNDFVTLEDTKSFFGAQNVIPVIAKTKATPEVTAALNAVSAKLDTDTLATLVSKVVNDKEDAVTVAADFLTTNGLG